MIFQRLVHKYLTASTSQNNIQISKRSLQSIGPCMVRVREDGTMGPECRGTHGSLNSGLARDWDGSGMQGSLTGRDRVSTIVASYGCQQG